MRWWWLLLMGLLYAHPLNVTKMELNLSAGTLWLRFASFNLIAPLHLSENPDEREVLNKKREIQLYTASHIWIERGGERCRLIPTAFRVKNVIVIDQNFSIECPTTAPPLKIGFNLFFDRDPTQTGVMKLVTKHRLSAFIFSPSKQEYTLQVGEETTSFRFFVKEGIYHIWEGVDHLTFLFLLILPALLGTNRFGPTLWELLKITTAFTISHSITLSLAVFKILTPPAPVVEVGIALTIFFTALNNFYHWIPFKWEWGMAFLFGFIHGFGFANALLELNLPTSHFAKVVFGFNLGVEAGQWAIVLTVFPILWIIRRHWAHLYFRFFQLATLAGGGASLYWIWERFPPLINFLSQS
jgi:hypothetical protein